MPFPAATAFRSLASWAHLIRLMTVSVDSFGSWNTSHQ